MDDPRRTVVVFHSNSSSPKARRWYRIAEACEFDGELFLHRDFVNDSVKHMHEANGSSPRNLVDAVRMAKAHADETGRPYVPGPYHSGAHGYPMRRAEHR